MESRIEELKEKKLVGMRLRMTLAQDRTTELWRSFMPRRGEVRDRVGTDFISMRVYDKGRPFAPDAAFDKWAAVEATDFSRIPEGMEPTAIPGGKYAVFIHEGPASAAPKTFGYIFGTWLPASGCQLDDRPHFEVLPADYRPDDPNAREEIWVPVK